MKTARIIYHLARADFLERARRYSFLLTLAATLFLAYQVNSGHMFMSLGHYRGLYNSAWLGMLMAMSTTLLISLLGFYVIKNTIERDRETRVGQILAATPVGRRSYIAGKALSNFALLSALVGILMVAAVFLQLWQAEDPHVELWKLWCPFLVITIPAFAFLAVLAVLFECIPALRGGFGNVFYFFFWTGLLGLGLGTKSSSIDFLGVGMVERILEPVAKARFADYRGGFSLQAGSNSARELTTFRWDGIDWTAAIFFPRLLWIALAVGGVIVAAALFDRFDPSRGFFHRAGAAFGMAGEAATQNGAAAGLEEASSVETGEANARREAARQIHLSPLGTALETATGHFRFGALVVAELRLMLKGRRWWWYAVAAGLVAGELANSGEAQMKLLAFAWFWPVLLWSAMGARETKEGTAGLVFSSAHALGRQLSAVWVAGAVVALASGSGAGVRLLAARSWPGLGAWLIGAMFIPSLALAMGVWSRGSKLFECFYTALWYIGPLQPTRELDFIGASPAAVTSGIPLYYLAATGALLAVAFLGRARQIQH